jgi:catechol 2,3-dioxygenase-like lactoylglutathione lyase family enzyme
VRKKRGWHRLYGVRVFVDDLAAARRFYGEILGLPAAWEYGSMAVGYDLGAHLIVEAVRSDDAEGRALVGRFIGCSIAVDDIDATFAALSAKGVVFLSPPKRQSWGGVLAHFKDASGNVLTLLGR